MSSIYKFISLPTFVDMMIRQKLTFVHPTLWDDPYEMLHFKNEGIYNITPSWDTVINKYQYNNTFCQSWSKLKESDALWRIYSFDNMSLRIEIDHTDIELLDNVTNLDVKYKDVLTGDENLTDLIGVKRLAFEHEKEIRLVSKLVFDSPVDMENKIEDTLKIILAEDGIDLKMWEDNIGSKKEIKHEIDRLLESTNANLQKKIKYISFSHIPNFIKSVMLHPQAPDWFDETLKLLCEEYDLSYIGKSKLYTI